MKSGGHNDPTYIRAECGAPQCMVWGLIIPLLFILRFITFIVQAMSGLDPENLKEGVTLMVTLSTQYTANQQLKERGCNPHTPPPFGSSPACDR